MNLGDITVTADDSGNPILNVGEPCVVGAIDPSTGNTIANCGTSAPVSTGCAAGSVCTIVPGIPNTNIYVAIAAVAALLFFAASGGHR